MNKLHYGALSANTLKHLGKPAVMKMTTVTHKWWMLKVHQWTVPSLTE